MSADCHKKCNLSSRVLLQSSLRIQYVAARHIISRWSDQTDYFCMLPDNFILISLHCCIEKHLWPPDLHVIKMDHPFEWVCQVVWLRKWDGLHGIWDSRASKNIRHLFYCEPRSLCCCVFGFVLQCWPSLVRSQILRFFKGVSTSACFFIYLIIHIICLLLSPGLRKLVAFFAFRNKFYENTIWNYDCVAIRKCECNSLYDCILWHSGAMDGKSSEYYDELLSLPD